MTVGEILEAYADALIIQYRGKTKARATAKLVANCGVCDGLTLAERDCWDLETAIGAQLTILGKIVGVPRSITGLDLEHVYFGFRRYSAENSLVSGFGRYAESPYPTELFYRYGNTSIYTLTDFELRALIRLKIIYNCKFSSMKYLTEALYAYFGTDITVLDSNRTADTRDKAFFGFRRYATEIDNIGFGRYSDSPYSTDLFDRYTYHYIMTLCYQVKTKYKNAFRAGIFLGVIPKPMGVRLVANYII